MKLTVYDLKSFPQLKKMELIAGSGGLGKEITHCGILDYEYDKDLSRKYYEYNYQMSHFLTLSTFLYAKDNPNLIYDAVKKLIAKDGSGLIIKNIYRLPISDNVIRYADHNDFPIFILNDSYPFFEDIIVMISKAMERYDSLYYLGQKVEAFLSGEISGSQFSQAMLDMKPSLEEPLVAAYFMAKEPFSQEDYIRIENQMYDRSVIKPTDCMFFYGNGFMLIHSGPSVQDQPLEDMLRPYMFAADLQVSHQFTVGVSGVHHTISEMEKTIQECLYACSFADETAGSVSFFDDLGLYQAILPFAQNSSMVSYMNRFIHPLEIYDNEKNSHLLNTVTQFVKESGSLENTAAAMGQHKNTIRYRLNKAGSILGIDPLSLGGYEQLALAVRIYICSRH